MSTSLQNISHAKLPVVYQSAKEALAECYRIDECAEWANKAEALASYARQADDDELLKTAQRVKARAIRRCGELLKQIERPEQGGRPAKISLINGAPDQPVSRTQAARDAGLSNHQQKTALRVASVPVQQFESVVESDSPPTLTKLAEIGTKPPQKPLVEQDDRDPQDFRLSTQGQGAIERMAKAAKEIDAGAVARGASEKERGILKERAVVVIDWLQRLLEVL